MIRATVAMLLGVGLALAAEEPAHAQGVADLAINVLDGGAPIVMREGIVAQYQMKSITQTRPLVLTLSARNVGSVAVTGAIAVSFGNASPNTILVETADCASTVSADVAPSRSVLFDVGLLAPGEMKSCRLTLRALPSAARSYLAIRASTRTVGVADSNGSNNGIPELFYGLSPIDIVQDWQLEIRGPQGLFPPGATGTVDLILTNRGPETDPSPSVQIILTDLFQYGGVATPPERFALYSIGDPDCVLSFDAFDGGNGGAATAQLDFPPTAPFTARICTLGVSALPGAAGQSSLRFTATNTTPGGFDPDFSNNSARLTLQFTALAVPAMSANAAFVLVLAIFLLAAASSASRRRSITP